MLRVLPLLILLLSFVSCSHKEEKPEISASIYPLVWTVKNVYPTYKVYQIVKPGSNPHLYDLTPKDALHIENSQKVFLVGNLEPFSGKIPSQKKVEVVKFLNLPPSSNPHYWLSPKRWLQFASQLNKVEGLKLDQKRWKDLVYQLRELDNLYRQKLASIRNRVEVVMIHPAFYWTCKDYQLKVLAILESKEGLGISPKTLVDLKERLKQLKNKKVLVIYTNINPHAEKVAKMVEQFSPNVKIVGLDPLVSRESGDYIKLMKENLEKILAASR